MDKSLIVALLIVGVILVIASLVLRVSSDGKYELKTIDLALIIVPLVIAGLATGKLKGFDLFGVKADFSELWTTAVDTQIEAEISEVPVSTVSDAVEMIEPALKGGVGQIPRLIEARTQALAFSLGMGGYYGPAIRKYFDDLYRSSYLKYVVIKEPDQRLYGIFKAADLIAYLRSLGAPGYDQFEEMLNRTDDTGRQWIAELPGFVSAKRALTSTVSKRDALQQMEELRLDALPVVDVDGRFVGTVAQTDLTASLVLAVTREISSSSP